MIKKKYQKEIQTQDATKRSFKHTADSTFRKAEKAELMIFSGRNAEILCFKLWNLTDVIGLTHLNLVGGHLP